MNRVKIVKYRPTTGVIVGESVLDMEGVTKRYESLAASGLGGLVVSDGTTVDALTMKVVDNQLVSKSEQEQADTAAERESVKAVAKEAEIVELREQFAKVRLEYPAVADLLVDLLKLPVELKESDIV